jgi:O-antigen ligase
VSGGAGRPLAAHRHEIAPVTGLRGVGLALLWFLLLLGGVVFPPTLGVIGAYLAMFASLVLAPFLAFDGPARRAVAAEPAAAMLGLAFLLLLVAFSLSARQPADVLLIANFVPLLLFVPAYMASRRLAHPLAARTIGLAATGATLLSLMIAWHSVTALGLARAELPGDNPLHLAAMATVVGAVALVGLLERQGAWGFVVVLAPVCALLVAVLAEARGALLAFPLFSLLALLFVLNRLGARPWQMALTLVIAIGIGIAVVLHFDDGRAFTGFATVLEFLRSGEVTDHSSDVRLQLYSAAYEAFLQRPWFGHGWANFYAAAEVFLPIGGEDGIGPDRYPHLHSDLADFAVAGGILGIAAWLLILAAPVVGAFASPRDGLRPVRLYGTMALSLCYLVLGATNLMLGWELQTATYIMLAALLLGWCRNERLPASA